MNNIKVHAVIAFLIVTVMYAANLVVDSSFSHNLIRKIIKSELAQYNRFDIDFATLSLSIFPLRATVLGLDISDNLSSDEKNKLASIDHIQLYVNWLNLLLGRSKIIDLEISGILPQRDLNYLINLLSNNSEDKNKKDNPDLNYNQLSKLLEDLPIHSLQILYSDLSFATGNTEDDLNFVFRKLNLSLLIRQKPVIDLDIGLASIAKKKMYLLSDAHIKGRFTGNLHELASPLLSIESSHTKIKGPFLAHLNYVGKEKTLENLKLKYNFALDGDFQALGAFLQDDKTYGRANGQLSFDLSIPLKDAMEEIGFSIKGPVNVHQAAISDIQLFDTQTRILITTEGIEFSDTNVIIEGASYAVGSGFLDFSDKIGYQFTADITDLSLAKLLTIFKTEIDVIDFDMSAKQVKITGTSLPFSLQVEARSARLADLAFPILDMNDKYAKPQCHIPINLKINEKGLAIAASRGQCLIQTQKTAYPLSIAGYIGFGDQINLDIQSEGIDTLLAQYVVPVEIKGQGIFQTKIYGPYSDVRTKTSFTGQNIFIDGLPIGKVEGEIDTLASRLEWKKIQSVLGEQKISVSNGFYDYTKKHILTDIVAEKIHQNFLEVFQTKLGVQEPFLMDFTKLEAHLDGDFFRPLAAVKRAIWDVKEIWQKSHGSLFSYVNGDFHASQEKILLSSFRFGVGQLDHVLEGEILRSKKISNLPANSVWQHIGIDPYDKLDLKFSINESGEAFSIHEKGYLKQIVNQLGLKLNTHAKATIKGTAQYPLIDLKGLLSDVKLLGDDIGNVNLDILFENNVLNLGIKKGAEAFSGKIKIAPFSDKSPFSWYFAFKQLDIGFLLGEKFSADNRNYLYVTGDWFLEGTLSDFWKSSGKFNVESIQGEFFQSSYDDNRSIHIKSKNPASIVINKGAVNFDGDPLEFQATDLEARFSFAHAQLPSAFNVHMSGQFDLNLLTMFVQKIEKGEGFVNAEAEIFGAVDNLQIKGRLSKSETDKKAIVLLPEFAPELSLEKMNILFSNDSLDVIDFILKKGNGYIKANGQISFSDKDQEREGIFIHLDKVLLKHQVPLLKTFESVLNGHLQLTGSSTPFNLMGNIDVVHSRTINNIDLNTEILALVQNSSRKADNVRGEPFLNLDIGVHAARNIFVTSRELKLLASADLQIVGNASSPHVYGNILVDKGKFTYNFLRREFDIKRAQLIFDSPLKIDPKLDILAVTRVNPYAISLTVMGTATDPLVEFVSNPSVSDRGETLTQQDIIYLLKKGRLPEGGNLSGTEIFTEVANYAVSQLPFEQFYKLAGTEYIPIYADFTTNEAGEIIPRVNVPMQISSWISGTVTVSQERNVFSLERPVNENISASANFTKYNGKQQNVSDSGDNSVDLRFNFSFE